MNRTGLNPMGLGRSRGHGSGEEHFGTLAGKVNLAGLFGGPQNALWAGSGNRGIGNPDPAIACEHLHLKMPGSAAQPAPRNEDRDTLESSPEVSALPGEALAHVFWVLVWGDASGGTERVENL